MIAISEAIQFSFYYFISFSLEMSTTASRVIKNTGWLYAKMAITMLISLYTTRLVLNALGASDFGIYNIVGGTIGLLAFLNNAMATSTQRFMSYAEGEGNKEKQKYIFNISFIIHTFIAIFAIFVFTIVGHFFFNKILNIPEERIVAAQIVYGSMVVSTAFSMMSVPYAAVMNAHENMKYYAFIGIFEAFLKLVVAYVVVYTFMDKLVVYGFLMTLIPIIILTIMRFYCHHYYEECVIAPKMYFQKTLMKEMTTFAGWGFLSSASSILTMQGIAILLNMFGGVIVNAAHGVANQMSGQLMVFSNNMIKALNPVLVKSQGAGDTNKMLAAASTGNKLSFVIYTLFAIPFIIECPFILEIWLKDVPGYAVLFIRLVLIRIMFSQMTVTLETCISAVGKIKEFTIINSLIWISPLIVGYIMYSNGAPIYTIYLLLIALVLLRSLTIIYFCKKLCGLHFMNYVKETLFPCIVVGITTIVPLLTLNHFITESYLRLFIIVLSGFIIHIIGSFFFGLNANEKNLVKNLNNSILKK